MTDVRSRWRPTPALARALIVGGVGCRLAAAVGRAVLVVVLVAPLLVAAAFGLLHRRPPSPACTRR